MSQGINDEVEEQNSFLDRMVIIVICLFAMLSDIFAFTFVCTRMAIFRDLDR